MSSGLPRVTPVPYFPNTTSLQCSPFHRLAPYLPPCPRWQKRHSCPVRWLGCGVGIRAAWAPPSLALEKHNKELSLKHRDPWMCCLILRRFSKPSFMPFPLSPRLLPPLPLLLQAQALVSSQLFCRTETPPRGGHVLLVPPVHQQFQLPDYFFTHPQKCHVLEAGGYVPRLFFHSPQQWTQLP